jgi:hypothetical protein
MLVEAFYAIRDVIAGYRHLSVNFQPALPYISVFTE